MDEGDCNDLDLGMESESIPDSKITASSEKNANTTAKNGRLNSGSSWCAETSDSNPYLLIDLQTLHIICAVSTQGNSQADQWVKNYTLQSSINKSNWTDYTELEIGQVKFLKGNEDRNSEIKHILNAGVLARYLRFLPGTYHGGVCLRAELFGVKQISENLALGKPTSQSSTYSDAVIGAAESERAVDGNAETEMHCSHTNQDNPSWWRVDLALDHAAVYEIHIVNRFTDDPGKNNVDYKITFGNSTDVTSNLECTGRYSFIQFRASAICFTNPLSTGRYVGIMTTKNQVLQLCEVEIYSRENLAFGKNTDQKNGPAHGGFARLGVDGNSETNYYKQSCTHTPRTVKPWWRVDLGQIEPVSEVYIVNQEHHPWWQRLTNFEIRVGLNTNSGGVTNPRCSGRSGYSVARGEGKSFFCRPPLYGRYVTIRSLKTDALTLCEVEVYSERRACQIQALGVFSKDAFPDNSFSASSSSSSNVASKGRLNGVEAWSPSSNNNSNDYLQINLKYEFFICAIATQGKSTDDNWTTKYKLHLSLNNIDWVTYKENSTDKIFDGNSGRNDIVKHNLKEIARARFIRLQPTNYSTHKALRVEVFGILKPAAPSNAPSSFVVLPLSSTSVRASWQLPPVGSRHGTITGFKLFYQRKNSAADYPTVLTIQSGSTLSIDITGLRKYSEYEFQVLAFSSVGNGPKSSVQEVRTNEDVPRQGPENVSSTEVNSTTFEITWAALPERVALGVIKMYELRLVLKENCASSQSELYSRFNTTTPNMVLSGLLSICARYEVSVRGLTVVGPGPFSRPIVLQTFGMRWSKERPSSPSFLLNSTEAGLTVKITLPRFPANAKFFQVIVITVRSNYSGVVNSPESFAPQDLVTYDEAHESLVPAAYVTFQISVNDFGNYQEFIVGNGAQSNSNRRSKRSCDNNEQYYNKPLQPNTNYRVFLRAFVTEVMYISGNFVEIKTKEKPAVMQLPEKSILRVGELVLLTCEVAGDPEPSVTWTKNGNSSIPRAQFKTDGRILVIKDVLPVDSGVYECKASNKFGESRTSTTVIVAVRPRIIEEVSPSSVICEMQTLCTLSCHASSDSPFNYSWTKNGQIPVSDDTKILNNIIALKPREAEDYGVYVCHVTNSFGSTAYKITLSEGHKSSPSAFAYGNSVFYAIVITLSCLLFVSLVVIGVLVWRLRRALPENRATTANKSITDDVGQNVSPRDQHMSEPGSYMELRPRPLEGQSPGPPVYKSLQHKDKNTEYYNVGFIEGKEGQEEIYQEIGNDSC